MKVKNIAVLILILFSLGTQWVYSQNLKGRAFLPITESDNYEQIAGVKKGSRRGELQKNPWVVYSIRDRNPIYGDANCTTVLEEARFMDRFYVLDDSRAPKSVLRLVAYDREAINGEKGEFSQKARLVGWMRKEQLLCRTMALYNKETKLPVQATTVNTSASINEMESQGASIEKIYTAFENVKFYQSPLHEPPVAATASLFQIFYVMADRGNSVLLSKSFKITPNSAPYTIMGWCPKNRILIFPNNLFLEPNWETNAGKERKRAQQKALTFSNRSSAIEYGNGKMPSRIAVASEVDNYEERLPLPFIRYPIISIGADSVAEVISQSDVISQGGERIKADVHGKLTGQYNDQRKLRRQSNFVFVVDGTKSIQKYGPYVVEGIKQSINYLSQSDDTIQIGAVVFRDYSEEQCPLGNRYLEICPLSKNFYKAANFIQRTSFGDCVDKDPPEAMYGGIHAAVNMLRGFPDANNIIVLVGDAGVRQNDERFTSGDIIQDLVAINCNFLAFQIHNGYHPTFEDFIDQTSYLLERESQSIRAEIRPTKEGEGALPSPGFEEAEKNIYRLQNSSIEGLIHFVERGDHMDPLVLQEQIKDLLKEMDHRNEVILAGSEQQISGTSSTRLGAEKNTNITLAIQQLLSKLEISDATYSAIADRNIQFSQRSFTPLRIEGHQNSLYQYVILMNEQDLRNLIHTLEKLFDVTSTRYDRRTNLEKACYEILQYQYGFSDKEIMANMKMGDLISLVNRMPSRNPLFNKVSIGDIGKKRKVSDHQIDEILDGIELKTIGLKRARVGKSHRFDSNDQTYYWIPQNLLP